MRIIKLLCLLSAVFFSNFLLAQVSLKGLVYGNDTPLPFANVYIESLQKGTVTDTEGRFEIRNIPAGNYTITVSFTGYKTIQKQVLLDVDKDMSFNLLQDASLDEIVITGTLKPVLRKESPVPVEVYAPSFLKKNPTPSLFDALQTVNGVRPQLNCNVCNTGDIHINGLEGPYTLVLIDGMPIVSGLSTVYGLSGIPTSLIDRVEIVKGPASSLYGSEAVGGLINVITKLPEYAPKVFAESFTTSWLETNLDIGFSKAIGKAHTLLGINYFHYDNPIDDNNDNFTDVTLQERISLFNKWQFSRSNNRLFTVAGRFYYEDRWGGELQWNPTFRGGNEVYGESIYTSRYEVLGTYQLPVDTPLFLNVSFTSHDQNSVYGDTFYKANQKIGFGQLTWHANTNTHDLLFGLAGRYNYYDDNTTATFINQTNEAEQVFIPSLFIQDEITLSPTKQLLLGARYDYDNRHGTILTPRLAYKHSFKKDALFRLNAGTGFRVVNLFTEDHAALTGARDVIITEALKPEQSYNVNLNFLKKWYLKSGIFINWETAAFYTYFTNAILPDYDSNPNQIIYDNLDGNAISKGLSTNVDVNVFNRLKALIGITLQDVSQTENGVKTRQILTERFTATWAITYTFPKQKINIDYSGNMYGPMRLPLLGPLDPRPEFSPLWSVQNIQVTYKSPSQFELFGGVKNLLNWTPAKSTPFLIARANDPFDNNVVFDANGTPLPSANNPNALTFDPSYVYAPNQGIRLFLGLRYTLK